MIQLCISPKTGIRCIRSVLIQKSICRLTPYNLPVFITNIQSIRRSKQTFDRILKLRVKNGVLLYQKDAQDPDADVTWNTKRAGLLAVVQKNAENVAALLRDSIPYRITTPQFMRENIHLIYQKSVL